MKYSGKNQSYFLSVIKGHVQGLLTKQSLFSLENSWLENHVENFPWLTWIRMANQKAFQQKKNFQFTYVHGCIQ